MLHSDILDQELKSSRLNFDSFWESAQVVFICLIRDEWNLIMVSTMRAF